MPTTLSSLADRGEFRFVAVDAAGAVWRWIDEDLKWVRASDGPGRGPDCSDGPAVFH